MMNPIDDANIRRTIADLARLSPDTEIGGCITKGEVKQLPNIARDPKKECAFDLSRNMSCDCVWHTHTIDGRNGFSVEDIKASRWKRIPYLLYTAHQNWHYYDPNEILPFVGRSWDWVHRNCYTILQDWTLDKFDYVMDDFYLSSEYAWKTEDVGYVANLPLQGYRRIDPEKLQTNDIILMQIETPHPNHIAIYVDGTKNLMLHHLANQYSQETIYGSYWRKVTHSVWRFAG